jgi:hypothetical protein
MVFAVALLGAAVGAGMYWLTGWGSPIEGALTWGIGVFVIAWRAALAPYARQRAKELEQLADTLEG